MTNQFERSDVRVVVRGGLTDGAAGYAQDKMVGVLDRIAEPVLFAELKLEMATDPARPRPATVEAVVDLDGHPVRAKVAARVMHEAVDLVMDALERRIRRYEDRLHRAARPVHPTPHEWRHGDLPEHRPDYFRRPAEEREVVRRKNFAATPSTVAEAADELDQLGHDFYLFRESTTGVDAVVSFDPERASLVLQLPEGVALDPDQGLPFRTGPAAPRLTEQEALERLEAGGERHVFYVDESSGEGTVAYHRYDGNWGLITSRV